MKFNIDYLNTLPLWLGLTIVTVGTIVFFLTFIFVVYHLIGWLSRQRIVRHGDRYYICKGVLGDRKYLSFRWGEPDWWYNRTHADSWPTQFDASVHLNRPQGWYGKWKQKREYERAKAEQEARLKAHQEKMLKVRMTDFSNYG